MLNSIRQTKFTGYTDSDYVQIMKEHQEAAIDMYGLVSASGTNKELQNLATDITTKLESENAVLNKLPLKQGQRDKSDFSIQSVRLLDSLTQEGYAMHGAYIDLDFSTMMMQHHNMGMELSKLYLRNGTNKELISFARKQINSYEQDIQLLRKWKQKYYPDVH